MSDKSVDVDAVLAYWQSVRRHGIEDAEEPIFRLDLANLNELLAALRQQARQIDAALEALNRLTSLEDFAPETEPQFEIDHRIAFAMSERQRIKAMGKT